MTRDYPIISFIRRRPEVSIFNSGSVSGCNRQTDGHADIGYRITTGASIYCVECKKLNNYGSHVCSQR